MVRKIITNRFLNLKYNDYQGNILLHLTALIKWSKQRDSVINVIKVTASCITFPVLNDLAPDLPGSYY